MPSIRPTWTSAEFSALPHVPILPAFLPGEVGGHQRLEWHAVEMVVLRPASRDVSHDEDPLPTPSQVQVIQPPRHPGDSLPPALTCWVRLVEVVGAISHVGVDRGAVVVAVVALPQTPVEQDRHSPGWERNRRRLDSPAQIRAEHGSDAVAAAALTELLGQPTATLGQAAVRPPRRDAPLVVLTERMRLEHDHRRPR